MSEIPLLGDRSARDALNYPSKHANDIDNAAGIHHTLGSGAGQAAAGNHSHAGTGQYRQFVYYIDAGEFDFVKISTGEPVMVLQDLE